MKIFALAALAASACLAPSTAWAAEKVLTEKQNGGTVMLRKGDTVSLVLASNGTTGFEWQVARLPRFLIEVSSGYAEPKQTAGSPTIAGAAGQQRFVFRATRAGRDTLVLAYRQSWERGQRAESRFRVTVVAR